MQVATEVMKVNVHMSLRKYFQGYKTQSAMPIAAGTDAVSCKQQHALPLFV